MKKIWKTLLIGSLILSVSVPVYVYAADPGRADFIVDAVGKALEAGVSDPDGEVVRDLLRASDAYDLLNEEERARIPEKTREDLETLRQNLGEVIRTCAGVTAGNAQADEWYIRTNVTDAVNGEEVLQTLKNMDGWEGASPRILWHKDISYTDVRSGEETRHSGMISLTFPKPEGYEDLTNPKVLTMYAGGVVDLAVKEDGRGNFYIQRARTMTNIVIVDMPIPLTGISMEPSASVNAGQKLTLRVTPRPAGTTEQYQLEWASSDPSVAQVDGQGVVTGIRSGTADITASVKDKGGMRSVCQIQVVQGAHSLGDEPWRVMEETKAHMLSIDKNPTIGSEWFVLGLSRSGMDPGSGYFSTYYNHFANHMEEQKGVLTRSIKYTEYSKAVLTMTAIGRDARQIAGYDLLASLSDLEDVKAQGVNGPIWALIALNAHPSYAIPEDPQAKIQVTEQVLIDYLLSQETPGRGWTLTGDTGDPDLTGMALQALAPYYRREGYEDVTAAVDRALELLSEIQEPTGGYCTMGVETVESCVQVLTALCALGIDPETDERFVKGGCWTVENLLSYHIPGSGFMHVKPGSGNNGGGTAGAVNGMATEQGYYALTAYKRFKEGQSGLYDMSDIDLEAGQRGDGTGTGLETPKPRRPSPTPAPTKTPTRTPTRTPTAEGNKNEEVAPGVTGPAAPTVTPGVQRSVSSNRTTRTTSAAPVRQAAGTQQKNTVSSDTRSSDTKKKKTAVSGSDGWDFEGEAYAPEEDPNDGWLFEAEDADVAADDMDLGTGNAGEPEKVRAGMPFVLGLAGGVLGAAALELGRTLLKRRGKILSR